MVKTLLVHAPVDVFDVGLDLTFRPERLEADVALELGFLWDVE